ncbi:MAG: Hsp20/alpha crystallin family protein [archaeon]|nr:Hsp20/alpha crystallin family protein [archaeon]
MVQWKRRNIEDQEIDFETMEELFEELLETFKEDELDFSKPVQLGFTVSLDDKGSLQINEYGLLKERKSEIKNEVPLVDLIEFPKEFLIVIETNTIPIKSIDIKVLDYALIISSHKSKKFLKKVIFPSKVNEDSLKTIFNNGVLEIRLTKKTSNKNIMNS